MGLSIRLHFLLLQKARFWVRCRAPEARSGKNIRCKPTVACAVSMPVLLPRDYSLLSTFSWASWLSMAMAVLFKPLANAPARSSQGRRTLLAWVLTLWNCPHVFREKILGISVGCEGQTRLPLFFSPKHTLCFVMWYLVIPFVLQQ